MWESRRVGEWAAWCFSAEFWGDMYNMLCPFATFLYFT